jgi:hypothetical protein
MLLFRKALINSVSFFKRKIGFNQNKSLKNTLNNDELKQNMIININIITKIDSKSKKE